MPATRRMASHKALQITGSARPCVRVAVDSKALAMPQHIFGLHMPIISLCLPCGSAEPSFTRLTPVLLPPEEDKIGQQNDRVEDYIKPAEDEYNSVGVASWG